MTEPIAIVGLGCLFPDAPTPAAFWENLLAGRRSLSSATAVEFGVDPTLLYDPTKGVLDRTYCRLGGYVRDFAFDPAGYRLPAERLAGLDPAVQWSLQVGRATLEDAGCRDATALARCGLVLGSLSFPTRRSTEACLALYRRAVAEIAGQPPPDEVPQPGTLGGGGEAAMVAAALGLGGPSLCIDAACASSLYAIKVAADYLCAGRADLMLAGAVSGAYPLFINMGFSIFQAHPEDGASSYPLNRGSDGLIAGEGAGLVALKRLADAQRDGDRIRAVVLSVGLSNDGAGRHPLAPNARGQVRAFERAYAAAGVEPASVEYVECHATGTRVGDATELAAMESFFGGHGGRPLVGAVKSNLGHLLTAAGAAAVTKTLLAMEHRTLPPTVGVREPLASPAGTIGGAGVVATPTAWAGARAGVSGFGFGGTNAHLVLEAAPALAAPSPDAARPDASTRRLAVIGMEAHVGCCASLAALAEAVRCGAPRLRALPPWRWRGLDDAAGLLAAHGFPDGPPAGGYVDAFEVDSRRAKVPPGSADAPIPQHLLLLDTADRAIRRAGLAAGGNVAVIVAMAAEPSQHQYVGRVDLSLSAPASRDALHQPAGVSCYTSFIGNVMATRVASLWDFDGAAFTVTDGERSVERAVDLAALMLDAGEVEAVVVGAVDMAGGPEAVLLGDRPAGVAPADGAAAIVLRALPAPGDHLEGWIDPTALPRSGPAADVVGHAGVAAPLIELVAALAPATVEPLPPLDGPVHRVVVGGPRLADVLPPPSRARGRAPTPLQSASQAEVARTHACFLEMRRQALRALGGAPRASAGGVIWDEADLLEFAGGCLAPVFGPRFAPIDAYRRRVRLPTPPYLLVSRVTRLDAQPGEMKPASITTEYDVPFGAWYCTDGQVPWSVAIESGQCDLLLISYLGVDFENQGDRVYRLLDCTLTFLGELPHEGETLRYDIRINSFARSGETLLFFFEYDCYVGERRVIEMRGGCAGFFSDEELAQGRGVVPTPDEIAARERAEPRRFEPPLCCERRSFDRDDLRRLGQGDLAAVFGPAHAPGDRNPSLRLAPEPLLMLDRVVELDPRAGPWGLGLIVAEKDLHADDWYFPCHFRDDQVLAGSLMVEGCAQLLELYLLHLGFHTRTRDARFQPVAGLRQSVRCRGQVVPGDCRLTYRMEVVDLALEPAPYARVNVDVLCDGKVVAAFRDLGVELVESGQPAFDERHIREFATGSVVACFGPHMAVYDGRRAPRTPNGDLQLLSRVLEVHGRRGDFAPGACLESEYDVPNQPWFGGPETPYSILMELALQPCGFLSAYLGSTLLAPEADLHFRNLDGDGRVLRRVDLRGKTVRNRVSLLSSVDLAGVVIQKFAFEMSCQGAPFFRGESVFGYFEAKALANQVGLDGGARSQPWLSAGASARLVPSPRTGRMALLDEIRVVPDGGRHGLGYALGRKCVDPSEWFFACHFHEDAVMPGSLGVESMLEALEALAVEMGLGRRFASVLDRTTVWKYRGQIVRTDQEMTVEVHVTELVREEGRVTVVAEASLSKDGLRIYEARDLAIRVEADAP